MWTPFAPYEPYVALAVLFFMFIAFVWERIPADIVVVCAVAFLLAGGMLSTDAFVGVFANGALVSIGALFILSGALARTGALESFADFLIEYGKGSPALALLVGAIAVIVGSAFLNNTPVVMVMIPVVLQFAAATGLAASRMLIPLSYAAILGGACTLIGTSTNLLVDGVARSNGMEGFSLFEITPIALVVALSGMGFIALTAPKLLPDRETLAEFTQKPRKQSQFFTEVVIPVDSPLIGSTPSEVDVFTGDGSNLIDVLRGDDSLRREMGKVSLEAGDRVVLRITAAGVLDLRARGLSAGGTVDAVSAKDAITAEVLVPPGSRFLGRRLGRLRLRRRYGVYPLAVHRRGESMAAQLDEVRLKVGDTLLIEAAPDDIQRLIDDAELVDLTRHEARHPVQSFHGPLSIAVLIGVVALAAFQLIPIAGAAIIGLALLLVLGVLDPDQAYGYIDARLMALIVGMLSVGEALRSTGAVSMVVDLLTPMLETVSPLMALIAIFALTAILTELVTNNAVAVIMTPVAISLASALGYDPRGFVVAVMMGANSSFATPISYQTNMLVYAPGGYRFIDYCRIGIPLKIVTGAVAIAMIALIWPIT